MIFSLFRKDPAREAAQALYFRAMEQARMPAFYASLAVPDTVEGRFEQIALHVWLLMRRLAKGDAAEKRLSQSLLDVMFENLDANLRELGVGDLSVSRKIRTLAENFYGRAGAYEAAAADDDDGLARALGRNVYGDESRAEARLLAHYVRTAAAAIDAAPIASLQRGVVDFPQPAAAL